MHETQDLRVSIALVNSGLSWPNAPDDSHALCRNITDWSADNTWKMTPDNDKMLSEKKDSVIECRLGVKHTQDKVVLALEYAILLLTEELLCIRGHPPIVAV